MPATEGSAAALLTGYGEAPTQFGGEHLLLARIAILYADEDERWRDVAVASLADFTHALTPLRPGSMIDPGVPVLVIWTAQIARRQAEVRVIVRACADVIVWRPDGAPPPAWLADAVPIGPEMPVRSLALMAKFAVDEGERRTRGPVTRRRRFGRLALVAGVGGVVTLVLAGAAMLWATREPVRAEVAARPPVTDLRGLQ